MSGHDLIEMSLVAGVLRSASSATMAGLGVSRHRPQ